MKAWIQRVTEASVDVGGERIAEIGKGYLVLFAVTHTDTEAMARKLARRVVALRIFEDDAGKTNRSLMDVGGSVLAMSQFALYADTAHGHRPGFSAAARPETAEPLYDAFVEELRLTLGSDRVGTGRFGAEMKVRLVNDGPFSVEMTEG